MNMYNTDSGFRPPSPLNFSAPGPGLFGEPINYEDLRFSNPDFLLPTSPPPLTNDPTLQLFNPSEQRYFSEFLDTLVVDQHFTFDPSSIPNLPSLPMFPTENLPGFLNNQLLPQQPQQQQQQLAFPNNPLGSMDYESSQGNYGSHSPNSSAYTNNVTPAKRKTNKETAAPTGTPSRPSSLDAHPTKISTPIQQLSKLTLENTNHIEVNHHPDTTRPSKSKKNKREEDSHPYARASSSTSSRSNSHSNVRKEDSRENASVSDEYASDAAGSSSTPKGSSSTTPTTKRKPYKELLTEEEKRANHIASEQKRRNTIRNGFKDMTDIIPDLKDINSSKSTILFKAVDFIRYLEKRNKTLQEKADLLESRLQQRSGGRETGHHKGHSQRHVQEYHNGRSHYPSNGVTERLQDIPNFYPVS
ncbi:hypothetical protein BGZ82_004920 [Podila clonocystis]|nr:hypothetical protein BGZ82_004920 [Podila clonocystis]